jgi:hypothetical protein
MPNKKYNTKILILIMLVICATAQAQTTTVSGYITDAQGETLIGANIIANKNTKQSTTTNQYGYYTLSLPTAKNHTITVSFVGYVAQSIGFLAQNDTTIYLKLLPNNQLKTLNIVADATQTSLQRLNEVNIPIAQLKQIPAMMGEKDVIKALSFTPGVSTGVEGSAGLYVRGGTPDQNLMILDGTTVYNTSHLFGFLSVFNPDAIKDIKLIKGGFPARYGGRLSSIIDISTKDGNKHKVKAASA